MMRPLLIAALLVVPAAAAAETQWQDAPRDTEFQTTPGGVEASSRSADGVDRFDVDYDAAMGTLRYAFVDDRDGTRISMEHRIVAVIEWDDRDGDGRYGLGDRTVHRTPLAGSTFTVTSRPTATGDEATITYTLLGEPVESDPLNEPETPTGRFSITLALDGRVAPTVVPVRLAVVDHPHREDGTLTAFEVAIHTSGPIEHAGGLRPLAVPANNHTVFYAWDEQATVDGAATAATVTEILPSPRRPTEATVYYAFDGSDARQDTHIGVLRQTITLPGVGPVPLPEGDAVLFGLGAMLMAGIVGVPAARRIRRR